MSEVIPDFLTIKEFACLIRVHVNTVRRSIKSGRISAFRIGIGGKSAFRIPSSEINRISVVDLQKIVFKLMDERAAKELKEKL